MGKNNLVNALLCSNGGIVTVYTSPYFHITFTSPHQTDTGGRGRAKTEYMFIENATKKDLYIA